MRCEREGPIAIVWLNNPPMNPLTMELRLALEEVIKDLQEQKKELRAVVLTGAGRAFAAGADIKAFLTLTPETAKARLMRTHQIFSLVENFPRPVIAAIHGYCLGGGLELAMCCDIRCASADAILGFPEVGLSIFPGNGATARALKFMTLGRFKELVFTGRRIRAQEAYEYGLVERIAPQGKALECALEIAQEIARHPPLGVEAAKRVINRTRDLVLAHALEVESDHWAWLCTTHDMKEAARAFVEKRKPRFKGC